MSAELPVAVVIEDDTDIQELLDSIFSRAGFQVVRANNGFDGVAAVRQHEPVITTLDVSMPGIDGFAATRAIRNFSATYIIILSGISDEMDVVEGLDAGADDYVVKPFRPRELRARVTSALRRNGYRPAVVAEALSSAATDYEVESDLELPQEESPGPDFSPESYLWSQHLLAHREPVQTESNGFLTAPTTGTATAVLEADPASRRSALQHRGVVVDLDTREVTVQGEAVELTPTEFDLLVAVISSGRRVRTKADLMLTLRGESFVTTYMVTEADKRTVAVHMGNLRRKLGDDAAEPRWIETVRGVGYRLTVAS